MHFEQNPGISSNRLLLNLLHITCIDSLLFTSPIMRFYKFDCEFRLNDSPIYIFEELYCFSNNGDCFKYDDIPPYKACYLTPSIMF
eukprot:GAHX01003563.1.p1 GENE.GAHX01003563.1~~GAHX01003563.1.p1  ORF type:complete len:86 (+),score=9.04 GAHX01003563.1:157-414(+)